MLSIQAHCLVARKANTRPKPAKELADPKALQTVTMSQIDRKMKEDKEHQAVTHNIANKGFRSMRMFVARFNVSCTQIGIAHNPLLAILSTLCTNKKNHTLTI